MYFSIIRVIMGDKLKIKLSVANRIYPLTIDPSQEEGLRLASQQINTLIKKFEQNYSVRDKQDALAMCALQIASSKKQNSLNEETFITAAEYSRNHIPGEEGSYIRLVVPENDDSRLINGTIYYKIISLNDLDFTDRKVNLYLTRKYSMIQLLETTKRKSTSIMLMKTTLKTLT